MKLTCIIVDDEQPARALIREYIKQVPGLETVAEFKTPLEVIPFFAQQKVDIIFLDIQMPGITGVEFIKTLHHKPDIILTTAYSEYALEGYELDVTDYLMKPIAFDRFLKAINKVINKKNAQVIEVASEKPAHLLVKSDGQTHKVVVKEILFIEGLREYVTLHLPNNKKIITLESLKNLETNLPDQFLRVHKSFIVNKEKISSHSNHDLTIGDKKIPIGLSYRDAVIDQLF